MTIDILARLVSNEMSLEEVESEYDRVMESADGPRPGDALCLTGAEWTAFSQGVWFDELAQWRKDGWPTSCERCGAAIEVSGESR